MVKKPCWAGNEVSMESSVVFCSTVKLSHPFGVSPRRRAELGLFLGFG